MKRVIMLFLLSVWIFSFTAGATSYKINFNGIDDGMEWEYQDVTRLIYGDSHCNVDDAGVKYKTDNSSNDIWLYFAVKDYKSEPYDPDVKLIIYAEDEKFVYAAVSPDPSINEERFTFNALGHFDENNGISYEVRLGVKNGIPAEYKLRIQFADSDGNVSNIYDLNIINSERTATNAPVTPRTVIRTTRAATTKAPKTTKIRTTKATTEKSTVAKTAKSTAAPKTTAVHTTKPATTKKIRTTKIKTTKPPKKETVTVYKSETAPSVSVSESADLSAIKTNLSAGEKYKTTVIASGTVAVILIAALCAAGKKRG